MIKIELSTIEPQGMLFWQGKNDKEMSNYIALGIDNKHVSNNSKRSRIGVCSILRYETEVCNGICYCYRPSYG